MMPTHGLGVFHTMLAGSVTASVMHDVRCPIWTAAHSDSQHTPAMPRTVLCAVDPTNEGVRLLQYAALFSKRVGAALSVLHVVEPVSDWPSLARERELLELVRDTATQAIEAMLRSAGVEAATRIAVGGITERAAEAARADDVDLVIDVLGSRVKWSVPHAIQMVRDFEPYRLRWIEEPQIGLMEQLYLPAIFAGLQTTIKHMFMPKVTETVHIDIINHGTHPAAVKVTSN